MLLGDVEDDRACLEQGKIAVLVCRDQAWVSRKSSRAPRPGLKARRRGGGPPGPQAIAVAWRWSLRRLWVAVIRRHSVRTAPRPRRLNLPKPRLNFTCAKTGSIIGWRLR